MTKLNGDSLIKTKPNEKTVYYFFFGAYFLPTTNALTKVVNPTANRTLSAVVQSINRTTGDVIITGVDTRGPSTPTLTFTWIWGDGTSNDGFFPQTKKYADISRNYIAKVIANYPNNEKDSVEVVVDFIETFIVTNTYDAGAGSLRQAIIDANTSPGADIIGFNIPGAGIKTIHLFSALPPITGTVTINGHSQPEATCDSPLIALNGTEAGDSNGLYLLSSNNTIVGLVIQGFRLNGIYISNSNSNTIKCNYIGTNATGTEALVNKGGGIVIYGINNAIGGTLANERNTISGNLASGIIVQDSLNIIKGNHIGTNAAGLVALPNSFGIIINGKNNIIGGVNTEERNILSGNLQGGMWIAGSENFVRGNYIGTDVTGMSAIPNIGEGIGISGVNNIIGGETEAERNVISGNLKSGILLYTFLTAGNTIKGNYIGTNATGIVAIPNSSHGIEIGSSNNKIGGISVGEGNLIKGNTGNGITTTLGVITGNRIRGNNIYENTGLGIDLQTNGVSLNDQKDADVLPQNFPRLFNALPTQVTGAFYGTANATVIIDLYSNETVDAEEYGEGQTYLGSTSVTTNNLGEAFFTYTGSFTVGQFISATATDTTGNTSEFSKAVGVLNSLDEWLWDRRFGGSAYEVLTDMISLPDGSFLLGGISSSGVGEDKSAASTEGNSWIVKINKYGTKLWDKCVRNGFNAMLKKSNGEVVLQGTDGTGTWLLTIDVESGNIVNERIIDTKNNIRNIAQAADGNWLLGGYSTSSYIVTKVNVLGDTLWTNSLGVTPWDFISPFGASKVKIIALSDGGCLFGTTAFANTKTVDSPRGGRDYWLVRLSSTGTKVWEKRFGGTSEDDFTDLMITSKGEYVLGGSSYSGIGSDKTMNSKGKGKRDFWIVGVSESGAKLWDKSFGATSDDRLTSLVPTDDGGFIAGGTVGDIIGGVEVSNGDRIEMTRGYTDYWIVRIDGTGNRIWDKLYGGNFIANLAKIIPTLDGKFVLGGNSSSFEGYEKSENPRGGPTEDYWVIKINSLIPPCLTGVVTSKTEFCAGESATVEFRTCAGFSSNNIFTVQLSNAQGSFDIYTNIGVIYNTATAQSITINIPSGTFASDKYRIRVVSNLPYAQSNSIPIVIRDKPSAVLNNILSINPGESAGLRIDLLKGGTPFTVMLSNGQTRTFSISPSTMLVSPTVTTIYNISSVSNPCGVGLTSGSATVKVINPCTAPYVTTARPKHRDIFSCTSAQGIIGIEAFKIWSTGKASVLLDSKGVCSLNGNAYSDLTNRPVTQLKRGEVFPFQVEAMRIQSGQYAGLIYPGRINIWVDLNQDQIFSEDERLFISNLKWNNDFTGYVGEFPNPTLERQFSIPNTAKIGQTRLRIRFGTPITNGNETPCEQINGETEDYLVNISDCLATFTLSGTATNGTQQALQTITSTQIIPSGANVTYQAGNNINLQGTFNAQTGSVFKAEIKGCN